MRDENVEATGRVLDPAPRPPPRGEANAGPPLKNKGKKKSSEGLLSYFLFFSLPYNFPQMEIEGDL